VGSAEVAIGTLVGIEALPFLSVTESRRPIRWMLGQGWAGEPARRGCVGLLWRVTPQNFGPRPSPSDRGPYLPLKLLHPLNKT
jgi:hypothetical protein